MEAYADYQFYKQEYSGAAIPENRFKGAALKATAYMKQVLGDKDIAGHEEAVKMAMCEVAEVSYLKDVGAGKRSENNDGYSVSYETTRQLKRERYSALVLWLGNTGLLNMEVRRC